MNTEPIDVSSTAVALREPEHQQSHQQSSQHGAGGIQRFDAKDRFNAIEAVLNRAAVVGEVMEKVMKEGVHFGTIPGTDNKKVLLKAGAEKLSAVFRLVPTFTISQTDYQNFHREYRVTCRLSDGTEGVGTCTTLEEKYRFRKGARKCPTCGKETIIEGKAEYGGGWLCWAKKGGCGAKFDAKDAAIVSQKVEKVEHTNPADYWNTVLKMSKKRAHVDAIITATATSDLLTQDLEEITDLADGASGAVDAQKKEPKAKSEPKKKSESKGDPRAATKPIEVPRDAEANWKSVAVPAWSKHSKQLGFKTLGDLPKNLLWWWAIQWQPTPYKDQPIKPEEIELRKILDFVKENYDFKEGEEEGDSKREQRPEPPPVEDDVPF